MIKKLVAFIKRSWGYDSFWAIRWGHKVPAYDKLVHFIECVIFVKAFSLAFGMAWLGFWMVLVMMAGYEAWQHAKGQCFSIKDMLANLAGCLWGML